MNSFDKITLNAFLAALIRLDASLPVDLQKKLKELSNKFSENLNKLHFLAKEYSPLQQEYKLVRSCLQNDAERSRSSSVLETLENLEDDETLILSDEKLISFAIEAFCAEDSVSFAKKAYMESSELRQFFAQLLPQVPCYKISEIIGKYCIRVKDGQKLYDLIHSELLADRPIELDFVDVEVCAPPFLNSGVGQLLKDISSEKLNRLLVVSNLNPLDSQTLKLVIENSNRYYNEAEFRSRVDQVISEYANSF
jgi:STAS-like domain of unknown function (DUF4325)